VLGGVIGGILYLLFPAQMSTIGGHTRNDVLSLGAPAGTTATESNPAYKAPEAGASVAASAAATAVCDANDELLAAIASALQHSSRAS
jgi:hypothetical protein